MIGLPHIVSLEYLRPEDVTANARMMFEMGHTIDDCPYPAESDIARRWRQQFIACEIQREGEPE